MTSDSPSDYGEVLRSGLKQLVLRVCNVEGVDTSQITDAEPVIGGNEAFQLDSLDALEIVAALERTFGIKFESAGASRKVFQSFAVMSDYIAAHGARERVESFVASNRQAHPDLEVPGSHG
jgi:acyl carrier protein